MKVSKELNEKLKKLSRAMLDEKGRELFNPIPHHIEVTPRPP